ncbi:hypothetical protein QP145_16305, partial [Enterococcus faecalis]|nr:hypothetical protein [Enterococcus faecalis]
MIARVSSSTAKLPRSHTTATLEAEATRETSFIGAATSAISELRTHAATHTRRTVISTAAIKERTHFIREPA